MTVTVRIARSVPSSPARRLAHEITPTFELFDSKAAGFKVPHGALECVIRLLKRPNKPFERKLVVNPTRITLSPRRESALAPLEAEVREKIACLHASG